MNNCILVTARCRPPCRDREHLAIMLPCVPPYFDIVDSGLGEVMYWDEATRQPTTEVTNRVLIYTGLSAKLKIRHYDPTKSYSFIASRILDETSDTFYDDGYFDFTLRPSIIPILPTTLRLTRRDNRYCPYKKHVISYDLDVSIFEYTTADGKFHRDIVHRGLNFRYWGRRDIVSMKIVRLASHVTSLRGTFQTCRNMVTFECDFHVTSNVTSMVRTWSRCFSLTSFPRIDTSNVRSMYGVWSHCYSLRSFPHIDTSNVRNMGTTWFNCSSLRSFPHIDTSNVWNMYSTWRSCSSLRSFPPIDTSNVTNMDLTWYGCNNLPLGHCTPCRRNRQFCYYVDNTGGIMPDRRTKRLWC